jgi:predicted dehydrogenase/threonine dehydrogenase-like Zn-dependent dehydrogenase
MKQVLQSRNGSTVVRDVPAPPCPPGSLLVRNAFSVISSGTELSRVLSSQKSLLAKARERPDLVKAVARRALTEGISNTRKTVQHRLSEGTAAGYSSAGRVLEVGSAVVGFEPGDAVACAGAGHANHAEIVSVPANLCARVPDGVALDVASLTTVAAIALHSIRLANVTVGERVAVVGCGLVGQLICRLLRSAGADTYASDIDERRLEDARRNGADHTFRSHAGVADEIRRVTGEVGVDVAIVSAATSSTEPLLAAARACRDRGRVVVVGDVPIELPRDLMYRKELDLKVSRSYGPGRYDREYEERGLDYPLAYVRWTEQRNMECVLDLQARGLLDLRDLIEAVVSVDEAADAYARLADPEARPSGALLLRYDEHPVEERPAVPEAPRRARPHPGPARIGLVGPGAFARSVIVPAFAAAGAHLEVVGGGSGPSAEAAQKQFGFARVGTSEQAVVEDPDVDVVVVCTRHESHAALAGAALSAGKHVFCEKPLALNAADLGSVLENAAASDRILTVGFNRRFAPLLRELRAVIATGGAAPAIVYRVAAGRLAASDWQNDPIEGGGRILGEVCHFVDAVVYLADALVVEVHAIAKRDDEKPIQARDNVVATLRLDNGGVASIVYAADVGPGVPKEWIDAHAGSASGTLDDFRTLTTYGGGDTAPRRERRPEKGHREEIAAFLAGVRDGRHPIPLREIENVHQTTFAIVDSLRTGGPVAVVPARSVSPA